MQFVCFRSCCSCFFNSMVPYLCAPMLVPTFNGPVTNSEGGLTLGTSTTRSTHVSLDCSMNLRHSSYCLQTCTTCSFKSHSEYTFSHKRYRRCLSYSPTQVHKLLLNLRSSHSCRAEVASSDASDANVTFEGAESLGFLFDSHGLNIAKMASKQEEITKSGFSKVCLALLHT